MTNSTGNLFTRDDTLFGICEALGEDLGFHPNLLRVTLAVLLLWNPKVVLIAYAAAGVVVLATRLIWPSRRKSAVAPKQAEVVPFRAEPMPEALPLAA